MPCIVYKGKETTLNLRAFWEFQDFAKKFCLYLPQMQSCYESRKYTLEFVQATLAKMQT